MDFLRCIFLEKSKKADQDIHIFWNYFHFPGISVDPASIRGHEAVLTWSVSGVVDQIREYVVLYKPARDHKAIWSYKRTTQTQARLVPLQPLTNYSTWILGYTSSGKVYGSSEIHFVTTGGTVK